MKNRPVIGYITLGLLLAAHAGSAQDFRFSQTENCPMLLNPALAGEFTGDGRFMLNYRNQWSSLSANAFTTYAFSFDRAFLQKKLAAGVMAFRDQAGDAGLGTTQVSLSLATRVDIGPADYVKLGINGAWSQQSLQMEDLTWNSQYDGSRLNPALNSGEILTDQRYDYADFSTGLLWYHAVGDESSLTAGVSAYHVSRPVYGFQQAGERLKIRWCNYVTMSLPVRDREIVLSPSLLVMVQGPHREITAGAQARFTLDIYSRYTGYYKASYFFLGSYYRYGDAFVAYARVNYKSQFNLGISYDFTVSKLSAASHAGATEISLYYMIPEKALIPLK